VLRRCGLLAPTLLALLALACARAPEEAAPVFADAVVGDPLAAVVFCGEEARFSRELAAGEELVTELPSSGGGRLLLGGCVEGPSTPETPGHLEVQVEAVSPAGGAVPLALDLDLPAAGGRWSGELDLADLAATGAPAPARIRVRLRPVLGAGGRLTVRDLALRHKPLLATPARESERGATGRGRPGPGQQVLVISVDTLRPDGLSALGGPWSTPELDRFVSGAELWEPHYAASGWTKPSHASLLTGESPIVHKASTAEGFIHPGIRLISEDFRDAGFATAGIFAECGWLAPKFGFSRGFDHYRSLPWTLPQMVRHAVNWIEAHRDEPFFLFFHTFEAHSDYHQLPYEAPGIGVATVEARFGLPSYGCREGVCASRMLDRMHAGELPPLPREGEALAFLYGEGVRHLDGGLGRLFAELSELGLFDSMLIVLTSDHGESLLEHGEPLHANPWQDVVRVPLAIKWPRGHFAGERREIPTTALDLAPTLLAAAGLPARDLPGTDLRRLAHDARADEPGPERPIFNWGEWKVVVAGPWKLAVSGREGKVLLFHLPTDPREENNLAGEELERVRELQELLDQRLEEEKGRYRKRARPGELGEAPALSQEEVERLKALGYLGDS